jgi:hypothetical protein
VQDNVSQPYKITDKITVFLNCQRQEVNIGMASLLEKTQIPNVFFTPHSMHTLFNRYPEITASRPMASSGGHDVTTHAKMIMGKRVIMVPPHKSVHASRYYCQLYESKAYDLGLCYVHAKFNENLSTHSRDITCVQMNIKADDLHLFFNVITHAQRIMSNAVFIAPPHQLQHPSRSHCRV